MLSGSFIANLRLGVGVGVGMTRTGPNVAGRALLGSEVLSWATLSAMEASNLGRELWLWHSTGSYREWLWSSFQCSLFLLFPTLAIFLFLLIAYRLLITNHFPIV